MAPRITMGRDHLRYLELLREAAELSGRPWIETREDWNALSAEASDSHWLEITSMHTIGPPSWLAMRGAHVEARRVLLLLAIQIERYRLEHGVLPESLEAVDADPVIFDPASGLPIQYRRDIEGVEYLLQAAGVDGEIWEDAGRLDTVDTMNDIVFIRLAGSD